MADITKGRFGCHRGGDKHEPVPAAAYVQVYVKSSVLSRAPDLAISAHLMTEAEIDEFVDDALAELEEIRIYAKKALAAADSNQATTQASASLNNDKRARRVSSGEQDALVPLGWVALGSVRQRRLSMAREQLTAR